MPVAHLRAGQPVDNWMFVAHHRAVALPVEPDVAGRIGGDAGEAVVPVAPRGIAAVEDAVALVLPAPEGMQDVVAVVVGEGGADHPGDVERALLPGRPRVIRVDEVVPRPAAFLGDGEEMAVLVDD